MRVRTRRFGQTILLEQQLASGSQTATGTVGIFYRWPAGLDPNDLLHALCGAPDSEGYYPYNEMDWRWLIQCMRIASECDSTTIGGLGINDALNLRQTPQSMAIARLGGSEPTPSQIAAAGLAVKLVSSAFEATREEASDIVRMNLFEVCVPVER